MPSPTQRRGSLAEELAARHLQRAGLTILARNLHCRLGELDLVARHGDILVIAEVRQRRNESFGGAAASIDAAKQRRILAATRYHLARHPEWARLRVRFDALLLDDDNQVTWLRHAFEAG